MTLQGTLEDFSSGGILGVLSSDGRTGGIRFGGSAGCTIYLHDGRLYFAGDEHTDVALTAALVRPGRLSAEVWQAALDEAAGRPIVGELLIARGAIHPDLLASVALSVAYDPLITLFRTGEGDFAFQPGVTHWLGPFRAFPVDAIVAEVRRRVREADEWDPDLPNLDVEVSARRTLRDKECEVTLRREEWELLAALAGPRSIPDLATDLGRGRYSTARIVHRLSRARLLELSPPLVGRPTSARPVAPAGPSTMPQNDPVALGRPPDKGSAPELAHHGGALDEPRASDPVRRRRRDGRREAGRAAARRSPG